MQWNSLRIFLGSRESNGKGNKRRIFGRGLKWQGLRTNGISKFEELLLRLKPWIEDTNLSSVGSNLRKWIFLVFESSTVGLSGVLNSEFVLCKRSSSWHCHGEIQYEILSCFLAFYDFHETVFERGTQNGNKQSETWASFPLKLLCNLENLPVPSKITTSVTSQTWNTTGGREKGKRVQWGYLRLPLTSVAFNCL